MTDLTFHAHVFLCIDCGNRVTIDDTLHEHITAGTEVRERTESAVDRASHTGFSAGDVLLADRGEQNGPFNALQSNAPGAVPGGDEQRRVALSDQEYRDFVRWQIGEENRGPVSTNEPSGTYVLTDTKDEVTND